jgi:thymidylate kinase
MTERVQISTVAFEGPHRVGKGLNITKLSTYLTHKGTPHVVLRGDGTRPGLGESIGDPPSEYWVKTGQLLRNPDTPKEMWNYASYVLSKELLIWKNVYLPRLIIESSTNKGLIILDRSILSRTMIPRELIEPSEWEREVPLSLYKKPANWKGKPISIDAVAPDTVISLVAPLNTLIGRLEKDNSKFEFRKRLLTSRYDWYLNAADYIPQHLKPRVKEFNTDLPPDEVFEKILTNLQQTINI